MGAGSFVSVLERAGNSCVGAQDLSPVLRIAMLRGHSEPHNGQPIPNPTPGRDRRSGAILGGLMMSVGSIECSLTGEVSLSTHGLPDNTFQRIAV